MFYSLARTVLFQLQAETSHSLALSALGWAHKLGLTRLWPAPPELPVQIMGLEFKNPVGLAAGLDKNGDYIDALGSLGFGFIEIGTVTPRPQPGNPKPRLFRLASHKAIINRMGFNNKGVDYLVEQVRKSDYTGILGINIGKNFDTPVERAVDDYLIALAKVYEYADYVVINVSSPNTQGLRSLQHGDSLDVLLKTLKDKQLILANTTQRYVPLVIKIAPDLTNAELGTIAESCKKHGMDGVIATNTTLSRAGVEQSPYAKEAGGLSGAPLFESSTAILSSLCHLLNQSMPVIGVGGVLSGQDAVAKFHAGATLIQIYSGFIYSGPGLVSQCVKALAQYAEGD